jgi:hypothetical protein
VSGPKRIAPRSKSGWEEKSAALEKLFRDLPICKPKAEGIPYESLIPGIPDQLLLMVRNPRVRIIDGKDVYDVDGKKLMSLCNEPLLIQPTGEGLRSTMHAAERLVKALDSLSQPALKALALNYRPAALRGLKTKIRMLQAAAKLAGNRLAEAKKASDKDSRGRPKHLRGRRTQDGPSQATEIARVVAQHYRGLTNKKPTAHNKVFLDLLKDVYTVLGVKASAQSRAMTLSAKTNKQR